MLRVMELTLQRRGQPPHKDGAWFIRHYKNEFGAGDSLLEAIVEALSQLSQTDPEAFSKQAAVLSRSDFETAHFVLLRAYAGNGEMFADEAVDYLCEDPARLSISYGDEHWVVRSLLQAITPHCSEESLKKIEDLLLNYYTQWERSADGRSAFGYAQFTLIEGIAETRRSKQIVKRLEELRRKFQTHHAEEPMSMFGGFVGSPIKDDAAGKMTDQQWLSAIARYDSDNVQTKIVGDDLVGGAGELAGVMEGLAKQNPERFAKLALQFSESMNIRYFEAVLRGVAESGLNVEDALNLCRRCHNLPGQPLGRWIPLVVAKITDSVLPDEALEIVAWYATEDSDPEEDLWLESEADGSGQLLFGGAIDTAAINCVRGTAAQALSRMLFPDSARLGKLLPAIERLVNDKSIAVRASASWTLIGVLKHDRDLAVRLFLTLCSVDDAILRATGVERFMKYGLRTHYKILEPILDRMLKADSEEANIAGARLSSIVALFDDEARPKALACISGPEAVRRGAAQEFAANLSQARFRRFCEENLIILFNDESEKVRSEAARCF